MNSKKSIVFLTVVTAGIVVFWLSPGINKARDTTYTRLYEDTDRRAPLEHHGDTTKVKRATKKGPKTEKPKKVVYKSESIRPKNKPKISAKMFSRAVQFVPVDSLAVEEVYDSAKLPVELPL